MADSDAHLGRYQGRRHRRVHVAVDQHHIRLRVQAHRLKPCHDGRRLLGVGARSHAKIAVGIGDSEITEELPRHVAVVVLPGVHDDVLDPLPRDQRAVDRMTNIDRYIL